MAAQPDSGVYGVIQYRFTAPARHFDSPHLNRFESQGGIERTVVFQARDFGRRACEGRLMSMSWVNQGMSSVERPLAHLGVKQVLVALDRNPHLEQQSDPDAIPFSNTATQPPTQFFPTSHTFDVMGMI